MYFFNALAWTSTNPLALCLRTGRNGGSSCCGNWQEEETASHLWIQPFHPQEAADTSAQVSGTSETFPSTTVWSQFSHRHHLRCMKIHFIPTENLQIGVCVCVFSGSCEPPWMSTRPEWASRPLCCASPLPNPTPCSRFLALPLWRTWWVVSAGSIHSRVLACKKQPFYRPVIAECTLYCIGNSLQWKINFLFAFEMGNQYSQFMVE